jgi:hypothetical protein
MKNYLVITLGTSEVQVIEDRIVNSNFEITLEKEDNGIENRFICSKSDPTLKIKLRNNRDRIGTYLLDSPRNDGKKIVDLGVERIISILDFPLVLPALNHIIKESPIELIEKCILVYTDQTDPKFRGTDTLYFKEILKYKLREAFGIPDEKFVDYGIHEQVTKIDFQYNQFAKECKTILETPEEEVNQVIILAQGGIDQINQALTLQFIQAFKHKVQLYQKAEEREPEVLHFPQLFLNDLNKQKIIKHLDDYEFGMIDKTLHSNKIIIHLAQYAAKRLSLLHKQVKPNVDFLNQNTKFNFILAENNDEIKLKDLYVSAKIALFQKKYVDFLIKIYTLNENIFRISSEKSIGPIHYLYDSNIRNGDHPSVSEYLEKKDPNLVPFIKSIKNAKGYSTWVAPNRQAYFAITLFYVKDQVEKERYERVFSHLQILSDQRNDISHSLGTTDKSEIQTALGKTYSIEKLLEDIGLILNVSDFGDFDLIKKEIEALI